MKGLVLASLLLVLINTGCRKTCTEPTSCMQTKMEQFKMNVACPHGASIKEYKFGEQTVYVFDQAGCVADGWADVWTADCNLLGMLGGIAGFTRINGMIFYENAGYVGTIWEN